MITRRILTVILLAVVLMSGLRSIPAFASKPLMEITAQGKETLAGSENTSVLFIPAAAFIPYGNGYDYEKDTAITHYHSFWGGTDNGLYYAPVNLPQAAVVTKFTFYYYDFMASDGYAALKRSKLSSPNYVDMASMWTSGTLKWHSSEDDDIDYDTIDNLNYVYFVELNLPISNSFPDQINAFNVSIEYIPPATNSGVLSIPPAAFSPHEDEYLYENYGDSLEHIQNSPTGTSGWYYAPVKLPQGSVVTKFTFYWYDSTNANDGKAILQRTQLGIGDYKNMATAVTAGNPGYGWSIDDDIDFENIDNTSYAYWVVWDIPESNLSPLMVEGRGIVIEYTPAAPAMVLSIPAAAFTPSEGGVDFKNDGRYLRHNSDGSSIVGVYYAPVYLPQGVTVTGMTFHFYDVSADANGTARLLRSFGYYGGTSNLASAESSGLGGWGETSAVDINHDDVDYSKYVYMLEWTLPEVEDVKGCAVVIEYEYRLYLPLTIK